MSIAHGDAVLRDLQPFARFLYENGLNVFPQPYGQKGGWAWQRLQYIRLPNRHVDLFFMLNVNMAVMTGRTSNNLFVIDCETEATFVEHGDRLKEAGIPRWSVRSGGGGGHYYLFCKDGEVKNRKDEGGQDYEIRGNRCYVLTAGSRHPNGTTYHLEHTESQLPPTVGVDDVPWLDLEITTSGFSRFKKEVNVTYHATPANKFSKQTREFMTYGAPTGSRNNRLFAAACDIFGHGHDQKQVEGFLRIGAMMSGMPENEMLATIKSAGSKPRNPAQAHVLSSEFKSGEILAAYIKTRIWRGLKGTSSRTVLLACCIRLETANADGTFRASVREIAEIAQMSTNAVSGALKRLQEEGWLKFIAADSQSGAHLYQFTYRVRYLAWQFCKNNFPLARKLSQRILPQHAAAEREALGHSAWYLYDMMCIYEEFRNAKDWQALCNITPGQFYDNLKKLMAYGLIEKDGTTYCAIPFSDEALYEHVAVKAETTDKAQKRRERHEYERQLFASQPFHRPIFNLLEPGQRVWMEKELSRRRDWRPRRDTA